MIRIDFDQRTYTCPFCGHDQAYSGCARNWALVGLYAEDARTIITDPEEGPASLVIRWFTCANMECAKTCIIAVNRYSKEQIDIYPRYTFVQYPDYVPQQLRTDYQEACSIMEGSPKAAATLLRRCMQGMIHDFWGIYEGNLAKEVSKLEGRVPQSQWKAIDSLRKIGNIGAHMEKDVNVILDVTSDEVCVMRTIIELLFEKWYIARHHEEVVYAGIESIAQQKKAAKSKAVLKRS